MTSKKQNYYMKVHLLVVAKRLRFLLWCFQKTEPTEFISCPSFQMECMEFYIYLRLFYLMLVIIGRKYSLRYASWIGTERISSVNAMKGTFANDVQLSSLLGPAEDVRLCWEHTTNVIMIRINTLNVNIYEK